LSFEAAYGSGITGAGFQPAKSPLSLKLAADFKMMSNLNVIADRFNLRDKTLKYSTIYMKRGVWRGLLLNLLKLLVAVISVNLPGIWLVIFCARAEQPRKQVDTGT